MNSRNKKRATIKTLFFRLTIYSTCPPNVKILNGSNCGGRHLFYLSQFIFIFPHLVAGLFKVTRIDWDYTVFSRVHVTLYVSMSVRWSEIALFLSFRSLQLKGEHDRCPKTSSFLGSGPDRGQSPVEWGDFPYVRSSVHPSIRSPPWAI